MDTSNDPAMPRTNFTLKSQNLLLRDSCQESNNPICKAGAKPAQAREAMALFCFRAARRFCIKEVDFKINILRKKKYVYHHRSPLVRAGEICPSGCAEGPRCQNGERFKVSSLETEDL